MGGGNSGVQGQQADEQGILHPAWAFRKERLLLAELRTQFVASATELVPLEVAAPVEEKLHIRYRGAELKLLDPQSFCWRMVGL